MKAHILVVDDDPRITDLLRRIFAYEGYSVAVAASGEEALKRTLERPPDLIVLDLMLPGLDGLEVVRRLRLAEDQVPVLMLTARDSVSDRVKGLDAGADDYLVKPFSFEELLARLRALLRRPPQTQANIIKVGDLTLDTVSYEVRRANHLIELSAKEFALLEYMMRNAGRVLSKDNIIAHVWDFDADVLPNTVEVYVGYLRNKIDKPFGKPLLHTNRGFGYRLGNRE